MGYTSNLTGERIREYLEKGKRFDGRKADEFRELDIEVGISKNAEGSARVRLGKTEVIVGVKMDISEPYADSPDKGNLSVNAELLPLSSSRFESGPPRIESIELARVIDRAIRESKFIEFDKLCVKKGEKVWTVYVDIYSINDDGNLFDAAGIGAVAALKTAKIPKYDAKEEKTIYGEWTDKKLPLREDIPISITAHKIGNSLIVDPTQEEEDISEVRLTAGVYDDVISSMQKGNIKEISVDEFGKMLELIEKTAKEINLRVRKFLKE